MSKHPPLKLLYDPEADVLEVDGVDITGEVLRFLISSSVLGRMFRITSDGSGKRTFEELEFDEKWGLLFTKEQPSK